MTPAIISTSFAYRRAQTSTTGLSPTNSTAAAGGRPSRRAHAHRGQHASDASVATTLYVQ